MLIKILCYRWKVCFKHNKQMLAKIEKNQGLGFQDKTSK